MIIRNHFLIKLRSRDRITEFIRNLLLSASIVQHLVHMDYLKHRKPVTLNYINVIAVILSWKDQVCMLL